MASRASFWLILVPRSAPSDLGRCAEMQIGVAKRAADRISMKLTAAKDSGQAIDMEEEFRLLTLQVIGEAVLSLPARECDRVSVSLPIANRGL